MLYVSGLDLGLGAVKFQSGMAPIGLGKGIRAGAPELMRRYEIE